MVHQQCTHLPAMTHFLDHHPSDSSAIPVSRCALKKIPLLLHAREFSIALVYDHVHERVTHLLRGHLAQVLPLAAARVVAKLNFFRLDRAEKCVEFEAGNFVMIDANLFAPVVKQPYPITKSSDFRDFTWHVTLKSQA